MGNKRKTILVTGLAGQIRLGWCVAPTSSDLPCQTTHSYSFPIGHGAETVYHTFYSTGRVVHLTRDVLINWLSMRKPCKSPIWLEHGPSQIFMIPGIIAL